MTGTMAPMNPKIFMMIGSSEVTTFWNTSRRELPLAFKSLSIRPNAATTIATVARIGFPIITEFRSLNAMIKPITAWTALFPSISTAIGTPCWITLTTAATELTSALSGVPAVTAEL